MRLVRAHLARTIAVRGARGAPGTVRVVAMGAIGSLGALSLGACSLVLDWNGYTDGGTGAAHDAGRSSTDGGPGYGLTCGTNEFCAPPLPQGWDGPVILAEVGSDAGAPECGAAYSLRFQGNAGLNAPPAQCTCTCSAPTGATCPLPSASFYSDSNCATACDSPALLSTSACVPPPAECASFEIAPAVPQGGSCAPSAPAVTVPPYSWSRQSFECAPTAVPGHGSCSDGEFCLPAPPPSFTFCVSQLGQAAACPTGSGYSQGPFVEYSGSATDGRGCDDCKCGAPAGASCVQPSGFLVDKMCAIPGGVPFVTGSCQTMTFGIKTIAGAAVAMVGTCMPEGSPDGGVVPSEPPTSFCCAP